MRAALFFALIGSALAVTPFSAATTRVCGDNRVCQRNGDLQALCNSGNCQCADAVNFKAVSSGTPAVVYSDCVPVEETTAQSFERKLQVVITITFVDALCDKLTDIKSVVSTEIQTILGSQTPLTVNAVCEVDSTGAQKRMNFGVIADMTIGDLYSSAVINFEQNLLTALGSTASAADIGTTTADVSLNSLSGSKSVCNPREGTVAFGKRSSTLACWAISCETGYDMLGGELYCTPTFYATDDDELSGGAKAGIIVGVLGFVIVVILIVYCCFCKKDEENDDSSSSSSGSSSGKGKPDEDD